MALGGEDKDDGVYVDELGHVQPKQADLVP